MGGQTKCGQSGLKAAPGWGWGDSGLDQRPGGPDVNFLSNNNTFKWFASIISVLKVSNYTFF